MNDEDGNIITKIKNSKYFEEFVESFEEDITVYESRSYIYRPTGLAGHYLVVLRVSSSQFDKMNLIFKVTENDKLVDAEAQVDVMGGRGEPEEIDKISFEESLKDKIRKLKNN